MKNCDHLKLVWSQYLVHSYGGKFHLRSAKRHIGNNRKIAETGAWPFEIEPLWNVHSCALGDEAALGNFARSSKVSVKNILIWYSILTFQSAFLKYAGGSSGVKTSSFNLRLILWEAGITVSNKVLECLVLRFSKNKVILSESYITVMIRLHLAHGEFININFQGHNYFINHSKWNSECKSQLSNLYWK